MSVKTINDTSSFFDELRPHPEFSFLNVEGYDPEVSKLFSSYLQATFSIVRLFVDDRLQKHGDDVHGLSNPGNDVAQQICKHLAPNVQHPPTQIHHEGRSGEYQYLGIKLNDEARTLRRAGYDCPVEFLRSQEAWGILKWLVLAKEDGIPISQRRDIDNHREYPAWRSMKQRINERLEKVSLKISDGSHWVLRHVDSIE